MYIRKYINTKYKIKYIIIKELYKNDGDGDSTLKNKEQ
jgi:hypothetical protein